MTILTQEQTKRICDRVLSLSKADECSVNVNGSRQGNIRFARNAVSTAGLAEDTSIAVQVAFGKRQGIATINEYDDKSLEKAVRRAEELARLAPENPEFMPAVGKQQYKATPTFMRSTADIDPEFRAQVAAYSIEAAKKADSPGRMAQLKSTEYGLAVKVGQMRRALAAQMAALELQRKIGAHSLVTYSLINLADGYLKTRDFRNASAYAQQAIAAAQAVNDNAALATARVNLGQAYLADHTMGSGPYQVTSWEKGQQLVLEPNPNWKGDHGCTVMSCRRQ